LDSSLDEIEGKIELDVPSSYRIIAVGNDDACPEKLEEIVDEKETVMKHVVVIIPVILDVDEI
jgi:hypothetical protein